MDAQPAATKSVLLVVIDDDPVTLRLTAASVVQDGVVVLTASDSRSGLALIRDKRPHIVISDLMMPGLTGMDVLTEAMQLDAAVFFVLLTAHDSPEAAVEASQKGASDYILKPINRALLRVRIDPLIADVRRRLGTHSAAGPVANGPIS